MVQFIGLWMRLQIELFNSKFTQPKFFQNQTKGSHAERKNQIEPIQDQASAVHSVASTMYSTHIPPKWDSIKLFVPLCDSLIVLENLHMEVLQRILISIQAAYFRDFSFITNNYGYGWSWKNKRMCGLFTWHSSNLTSVFYLLDKRIFIFESK
jgi:hypothetical protein